jgi:hypothetical protein
MHTTMRILIPITLLCVLPSAFGFDRVPLTGDAARATATLPEPPKPDAAPAKGWYGLVSVDVVRLKSETAAAHIAFFADGEEEPRAEQDYAIDDDTERLVLHVPAKQFAELRGKGIRVEVQTQEGDVVLRKLVLQRFHELPTRKLLGKANGPHGPDYLQNGPLGFAALTENQHTAFPLISVVKGGAADRAGMQAGDLVLEIEGEILEPSSLKPGWDWFEVSHEARLGRAIEDALTEERKTISLTALRAGERREFELKLPHKHALEDGFPLTGKLAEQMRADMLSWVLENQKKDGSWPGTNAVNPALGGLALLSTRDPAHKDAIDRTVRFLLEKAPTVQDTGNLGFWLTSFQGMFFAEYHLAGGEIDVLPWMRGALEWLPTVTHESKWGMQALGHGPSGLPYDSKSLMAPTAHLLVFEALANRCGIESGLWEHLEPYILHSWSDPSQEKGHGGMGYNASYKDKNEFWSRSGLTALACELRGEHSSMRMGLTTLMQERHPWMLNSHAYGEPGAALGLISLSVANPAVFEDILPQWRWKFLGAWEPGYGLRYTTAHMGAPYMGEDVIVNIGYTILASVANQGLIITGGDAEAWL